MTDAPPEPKLDVDWLKTLAGALAAVTTAVLLSTLGAAGTLVGAALGSVAATVGTALYTRGLATSRQRVVRVQEAALQRVGVAQAEVRRAARRQGDAPAVEAHLEHADEQLAEARDELDAAPVDPPRAGLPWRRIALAAAGTFVLVVLVLSAFELVGGKPVSSYTGGTDGDGGTSLTRLTGSGNQSQDDDQGPGRDGDQDQDQDQDQGEPSDGPSEDVSPSPGDQATDEGPTPTPSPTDGADPTPSEAPSSTPSGSTTPAPTVPSAPTGTPAG